MEEEESLNDEDEAEWEEASDSEWEEKEICRGKGKEMRGGRGDGEASGKTLSLDELGCLDSPPLPEGVCKKPTYICKVEAVLIGSQEGRRGEEGRLPQDGSGTVRAQITSVE